MAVWLLKTEPEAYAYTDLVRDGRGCWDGSKCLGPKAFAAIAPGDGPGDYHTAKSS
ncbi:MAG: EVE domain-containing protein, partial [Oscillatoriales cyanobacterium SM2_1_8]|nr:EVE domain-containing protein [Oscillatoriales cyanobacterium SM2_1_8]